MNFLLLLTLSQVNVSFSHQPLESFRAAIGEKLPSVAVYSALVCNEGIAQAIISGGSIQQAAEIEAQLNVVAPVLVQPTAMRSKDKTKRVRALVALKWTALAATVIISAKLPHVSTDLIQGVTFAAGAIQVAESTLKPYDTAAQQVLSGTLSQVLDPIGQIPIAGKSCVLRLIFARYVPGFVPIRVTLRG